MKKSKVTIAVCVYNEEKNIEEFLDSLTNQTYKDFDIVIVDDGSKDNTLEKIKPYENKLKIKIIKSGHLGLRGARRLATNSSKGDIIITFDADEIIDKDCVKHLVEPFKDENIGAVGGRIISKGKGIWFKAYSLINDISYFSRLKNSYWLSGGCVAYRKKILIEIGGLSTGEIGEDVDASWKIKKLNKKILLSDKAYCYHKDPVTFKQIIRREYSVGKRAKNLFGKHKRNLFDIRFIYRFLPLIFILLFPFIFWISLSFFFITFILFLFKSYHYKYNIFENFLSFILLNIINIAWTFGFIWSIF